MADKIRKWTDKELQKMEKEIEAIYAQSAEEIVEKWNEYMERAEKRLKKLEKAYSDALKTDDKALIETAAKNLQDAKKNITLRDEHYKEMVQSVTRDISQVNQTAVAYMNGQLSNIYIKNYTDADSEMNVLFTMRDESTIRHMITTGDIELPKKKVNIPKDMQWNTKKLNSAVLQGILQGESIQKIAKRIEPIINTNKASAIRNARTMVTGAENRGREDKYHELKAQGFLIEKEWIATGDSRTRDWHLVMDGQRVELDEKFLDGNGNELEYPADPHAKPETVYNCRCSMKSHISGFKNALGEEIYFDDFQGDTFSQHDEEIIAEQVRRFQEYNRANQQIEIVRPEEFRDTFHAAKNTIAKGSEWRVDSTHGIRDYKNDRLIVFNGGSTVAVTPKGDIISVCKNANGAERGSDLLKVAVENGGDRLDAFGNNLYSFYTKNGFEPVSWTPFNEEYAPDDWVKGRDEPEPVIFYRYTGNHTDLSYDDFLLSHDAFKEYDDAMKYRDNLIAKLRKK